MILVNNQVLDTISFSEKMLAEGLCIYEVIRIFNGAPIFLNDNLLRLDNSLKKSNIPIDPSVLHIPDKIRHLIQLEHIEEGNIKYLLHFTNGQTDEYLYSIPHTYPAARDYRQGVDTVTCQAIRKNPEVKYLNPALREQTDELIRKCRVYEVILTDAEGYITEGSRSNIFFIKENIVYTAPVQYVLPGTSRKRVIDICKKQGIPVKETRIALPALPEYEAAFITGTSPLVLPIRKINHYSFDVQNITLRTIMSSYFTLLENPD